MTTYNASTVSDTAIASGKPITLQQGRALRDNPIAITEGASGAPQIVGKALDLFLGNFTFTDTEAGLSGLGSLDGMMVLVNSVNSGSSARNMQIRMSNDGGTTWGSWQNTGLSNGNGNGQGIMFIGLKSGLSMSVTDSASVTDISNGWVTLTVPSGGADAFQFRASGSLGGGNYYRAICLGIGTLS